MPTPPSTDNYVIGKGVMSIAEWSGGAPGAYIDMGNCPVVDLEPTVERLDHFSSRAELREKDKSIIVEVGYNLTFDCDEIAARNLKRFLLGDITGGNIVYAMQNPNQEYALKFVTDNPVGPNYTWEFWKATLAPNGPMSLIGEEWMVMSFLAEGLADRANHPESPFITVTGITTTTTSTTTT